MTFPDLIVTNARIVTFDPARLTAEAMAVARGRILATGPRAAIEPLAGPATHVVDLAGRMVLPGFQDTHIHLLDGGEGFSDGPDLTEARTVEALQALLADYARANPGGWVKGLCFNGGLFSPANLDRHVLDRAVPDRPCFVLAADGHNACLNSAACAAVGLVSGTADPQNGHFVLDTAGEPTGFLYEDAIYWTQARMPAATGAGGRRGVQFGQALANRHGITGVLDALVLDRHVRIYAAMEAAAELTVRVAATAWIEATDTPETAVARLSALRARHNSDMFKVHSAKFFFDGVFENRTAVMIEPFSDAEGGNGEMMFHPDQIGPLFTALDAARFQIHVHTIGDGAVRAALDGVETARRHNGPWPALHQLTHLQVVDPADIPRFAALGVVANIQTLWAQAEVSNLDIVAPMVGPDRARWTYPFRSLLDAGATHVLSSDWYVSTLNPFQIMETAVTRQPPGARDHPVFQPEQRLTRQEALAGYTVNAARAAWNLDTCGTLSPGKYADFIVVDRDILACDIYELGQTRVLWTVLGGHEVWRCPETDLRLAAE